MKHSVYSARYASHTRGFYPPNLESKSGATSLHFFGSGSPTFELKKFLTPHLSFSPFWEKFC